MKITMNAKDFNQQYELATLTNTAKEELNPKKQFNDKKQLQLTADGRKIYRTDLVLSSKENEKSEKATISILTPTDIRKFTPYEAVGNVTIVHYLPEGSKQMGVSITVDEIRPVGSVQPK